MKLAGKPQEQTTRLRIASSGWSTGKDSALLNMAHSLPKQGDDVLVFDAVVDFLAVPARLHQPHLTQTAKMMGDGRFADPDHCCQRVNVNFLRGERKKDADATGVAKGAEEFRHVRGGVFVKEIVWR